MASKIKIICVILTILVDHQILYSDGALRVGRGWHDGDGLCIPHAPSAGGCGGQAIILLIFIYIHEQDQCVRVS